MAFSRQEYWSGSPCPPPGDLPDPGTDPCLLGLLNWQVGSYSTTWEAPAFYTLHAKFSSPYQILFSAFFFFFNATAGTENIFAQALNSFKLHNKSLELK